MGHERTVVSYTLAGGCRFVADSGGSTSWSSDAVHQKGSLGLNSSLILRSRPAAKSAPSRKRMNFFEIPGETNEPD